MPADKLPHAVTRVLRMPIINRLALDRRPQEQARFLKFAAVGALGMVIDLSILYLLRSAAGLPLLVAASISFSLAVISNFTWNRLWTFPESRARPLLPQLGIFALVSVVGLGISNGVLWLIYSMIQPFVHEPWNYLSAKVIAIGVVLFWNYSANRVLTYRGIR